MASDANRDEDKEETEALPEHFTPQRDQVPVYACVLKGAGDALAGAVMGSVFGFGSGLFKRQGFKGALKSGASSAKTFALFSGIHGFMTSLLVQIRGKRDALNAGIAGCATGVAISSPGNPAALLQGCVTFGLFSYFIERMNTQTALATAASCPSRRRQRAEDKIIGWELPALPPFVLAPAFSEAAMGHAAVWNSHPKKYGAGSRQCRVCGNGHGLIRKYAIMCCRQCFKTYAKDIGFVKYR